MRQSNYLNVILTVNAVLLAGLLWTQIVGRAPLDTQAIAQSAPPASVPNASDQRQRMIDALNAIKTSVDATRRTVESGKMKVEVSNIDALKGDKKP